MRVLKGKYYYTDPVNAFVCALGEDQGVITYINYRNVGVVLSVDC